MTPPALSPLRHLQRPLPRPAFGSSPNLQALVLEAGERAEAQQASNVHASLSAAAVFYEVTIASIDQPKLLSRLSECLGDIGLNICEAHAFNTRDHYSLDVFVVNGWFGGGSEEFEETLSQRLQELPPPLVANARGGVVRSSGTPGARGTQEHSKPLSPLAEQRVSPEDLLGMRTVRVARESVGGRGGEGRLGAEPEEESEDRRSCQEGIRVRQELEDGLAARVGARPPGNSSVWHTCAPSSGGSLPSFVHPPP